MSRWQTDPASLGAVAADDGTVLLDLPTPSTLHPGGQVHMLASGRLAVSRGVLNDAMAAQDPDSRLGHDLHSRPAAAAIYRGTEVSELADRVSMSDWYGALVAAPSGPGPWGFDLAEVALPAGSYLWNLATDVRHLYALVASEDMESGGLYRVVSGPSGG